MARLEISFLSGKTQNIELSKQQPVSIGSHSSNDLQVDDVASMQCRISWNKKGYELIAATSDGVEINGVMSGRSQLNDGDLIRIGEADILFTDEVDLLDLDAPLPDVTGGEASSMYDLKPVSSEQLDFNRPQPEPVIPDKSEPEKASSKSGSKKKNGRRAPK